MFSFLPLLCASEGIRLDWIKHSLCLDSPQSPCPDRQLPAPLTRNFESNHIKLSRFISLALKASGLTIDFIQSLGMARHQAFGQGILACDVIRQRKTLHWSLCSYTGLDPTPHFSSSPSITSTSARSSTGLYFSKPIQPLSTSTIQHV